MWKQIMMVYKTKWAIFEVRELGRLVGPRSQLNPMMGHVRR